MLRILCDDMYTKDVDLYLELLEPRQIFHSSAQTTLNQLLSKPAATLTERERVALLGRPKLGENAKIKVHIVDCTEFKNLVDRLVGHADSSLLYGSSTWRDQFVQAFRASGSDEHAEDENVHEVDNMEQYFERRTRGASKMDYFIHFFTVFWKLVHFFFNTM